jgi:hypothetical protein
MPIYHIVLFRLKPHITATSPEVAKFTSIAKAMVGKIPGLSKLDVGPPEPSTAARGQGFNMGLVAILDRRETIKVYAEHDAHLE